MRLGSADEGKKDYLWVRIDMVKMEYNKNIDFRRQIMNKWILA